MSNTSFGSLCKSETNSLVIIYMAKRASNSFFFFLLFLFLLFWVSSGTLVGFSVHAKGTTRALSLDRTMLSFLEENNVSPSQLRVSVSDREALSSLSNTGLSLDLYLNQNQLQNLSNPKCSSLSWLKTHVASLQSIVATIGNGYRTGLNELTWLLPTLKSVQSVLNSFGLGNQVKVSVAFPLSFLNNMSRKNEKNLCRVFRYIKKVKSFVMVEAFVDEETTNMGDEKFVRSLLQKASFLTSYFPCDNNIPMILTIKTLAIQNPKEVLKLTHKVSLALQNNPQITANVVALYAQVGLDFSKPFPSFSHRELIAKSQSETTQHDTIFPTAPITNAPTVVTVNPSPIPVTITNPDTPIVTVPLTAPPVTNPVTTPITVPGAQPITNPVTTYPTPAVGNVPIVTPVTANPIAPPASNIPGQTWCISRTGVPETNLQAALDYACGGGADCSQIQPGGSCYNPNTLQNHASYAFNSFYQRNPVVTSCDFGGNAAMVNANPSSGSCIYPTSASSSTSSSPLTVTPITPAPVTPAPVIPTPVTPTPVTPTPSVPTPSTPVITNPATGVATPSWTATPGSGSTPPSVLNTSTGTGPDFGLESPPGYSNSSSSKAASSSPLLGFLILVTTLVMRRIILA